MSTKPSITDIGRWIATGNREKPSTGQEDAGFQPDAKLPAEHVNDLFACAYLWHQYLYDGSLVGDHSIDGGLTVDEDLDVGGDLYVAGNVMTDIDLSGGADLNCGSGSNVNLNGNKLTHTRIETETIPLRAAVTPGLTSLAVALTSPTLGYSFPFQARVGRRLVAVRGVVDDASGTVLRVRLFVSVRGANATVPAGTAINSAGTGAVDQDISLTFSSNVDVASGSSYWLDVSSTGGSSACTVKHLEYDYITPP